jgi:hypothetical protein
MPIATPQGTLDFKSVDKVTFVGASSNTVIDTTTGSLGVGVGVGGPTSNLHVVGDALITGNVVAGYLYGDGSNISGISGSSSIPAPLFVDSVNNRVGIGTSTPDNTFHISGTENQLVQIQNISDTARLVLNGSSGTGGDLIFKQAGTTTWGIASIGDSLHFLGDDSTTQTRMTINNAGNVGINTDNPFARLEVIGAPSVSISSGSYKWFHYNNNLTTSNGSWGNACIYGNGHIVSGGALMSHAGTIGASDERIKKDIIDVEDGAALVTLRLLKPKQYKYRDEVQRGTEPVWGFIAQEVGATLPYATQTRTDCLPNIYELANVSGSNVITFTNFDTSNLESNMTVLKVYDVDDAEHLVNIAEIVDERSVRVDEDLSEWYGTVDGSEGDKIFVYGQQVDDFVFLKKDAIWTVATSALQELDRQLQEVDRQLQAEKARNDALEARILALENA